MKLSTARLDRLAAAAVRINKKGGRAFNMLIYCNEANDGAGYYEYNGVTMTRAEYEAIYGPVDLTAPGVITFPDNDEEA